MLMVLSTLFIPLNIIPIIWYKPIIVRSITYIVYVICFDRGSNFDRTRLILHIYILYIQQSIKLTTALLPRHQNTRTPEHQNTKKQDTIFLFCEFVNTIAANNLHFFYRF